MASMPSKGSAAGAHGPSFISAFYAMYFPGFSRKSEVGGGGEENSLSPAFLENGSGQVLSQESWWAVLG